MKEQCENSNMYSYIRVDPQEECQSFPLNQLYLYQPKINDFPYNPHEIPFSYQGLQQPYAPYYEQTINPYYSLSFPWNNPTANIHQNLDQGQESQSPENIQNNNGVLLKQEYKQEDEEYQQEYQEEKSPERERPLKKKQSKKQRMTRIKNKNNLTYYWGTQENIRYHDFLKHNYHLFELTLNQKKALRVNVLMSKKVKTRNSQQCHSHHQKMMRKYGTLENLLQNMEFCRQRKRKQETVNIKREEQYSSQNFEISLSIPIKQEE